MDADEERFYHDVITVCVRLRVPARIVLRWRDYNEQYYWGQRNASLSALNAMGHSNGFIGKEIGMSTRHLRRINNGGTT